MAPAYVCTSACCTMRDARHGHEKQDCQHAGKTWSRSLTTCARFCSPPHNHGAQPRNR